MNKTFSEAETLITEIAEALDDADLKDAEVVLCPPALYLEMATDVAFESNFTVGAQNVYPADSGAFTGEISPLMLKELNVSYCIIGHSERRKYFSETNDFLQQKVDALLKHDICPIFCCGEVLPEREANQHFEVVKKQVTDSLFHLPVASFNNVVIAYEPVWAIGTGLTATPGQAQEVHAFIRGFMREKYGQVADEVRIQYGGSVKPDNVTGLMAEPDIDGALVGGASLNAESFIKLVRYKR